jgi:hypothetical protein
MHAFMCVCIYVCVCGTVVDDSRVLRVDRGAVGVLSQHLLASKGYGARE